MFVGAYWSRRRESPESAAARIAMFLRALADYSDAYATWHRKTRRRADALRSTISIDAASLTRSLEPNRRDSDNQPIVELGYTFTAWNGRDASLSATLGGWSEYVMNAVVLDLGAEPLADLDGYRQLVEAAVSAFDPDHAVATDTERLRRAGGTVPWAGGLFTYHRGEGLTRHVLD